MFQPLQTLVVWLTMVIRQMRKQDYMPIKTLFDKAYEEYLEFLKLNNPQRYIREKREKQEVTQASFNFFI